MVALEKTERGGSGQGGLWSRRKNEQWLSVLPVFSLLHLLALGAFATLQHWLAAPFLALVKGELSEEVQMSQGRKK